jgi:hypothetical protein
MLAAFEQKESGRLKDRKWKNYLLWAILKQPLFFHISREGSNAHAGNRTAANGSSNPAAWRLLFARLTGTLSAAADVFLRNSSRKRGVLVFANSIDKRIRNSSGANVNILVDRIVLSGLADPFLYCERSDSGEYFEPSAVKRHVSLDDWEGLAPLVKRLLPKPTLLRSDIEDILDAVECFFKEEGHTIRVDRRLMMDVVGQFRAERLFMRWMLAAVRPKLIVWSEKPCTGHQAAANERKVPSIDLQHGIIDRLHPQYVFHSAFREVKNSMAMPGQVGLFGAFHKTNLLDSGFWTEDELVVLGSSRMERYRSKVTPVEKHPGNELTILIPTQWNAITETKELLAMVMGLPIALRIWIKLHPMESADNVVFFERFAEEHERRVEIKSKNDDIYDLIRAADIMIGFDSASLLESIVLGTPVITMATAEMPEGIHTYLNNMMLSDSIRLVRSENPEQVGVMLARFASDAAYREQWQACTRRDANSLYDEHYLENIKTFLHDKFKRTA